MNTADITAIVAPVVQSCGLELDAVELMPAGKRTLVRVVVDGDGPVGHGPDMDEIARASRAVSSALDESDVTGEQPYTLEVSSRGTSRPLTKAQHWRRNQGRLVRVTTTDGTVEGRVLEVTEQAAVLATDAAAVTIPFESVKKALVQIEFNRPAAAEEAPDDDLPEEE